MNAKNRKMLCRKIFGAAILLICFNAASAQTKFQFGITANPLLSWLKSENPVVEKGPIRAGFEFGLMTDVNFNENYILATGITLSILGGNLTYTDSVLQKNNFPGFYDLAGWNDVETKYKLQYLNVPLVFKMRTNEIGMFKYFGALGLVPAFRVKARLDAEAAGKSVYDNVNIVRRKDGTNDILQSNIFQFSLHAEAGIEYPIKDKTSIIAGVFYRHGFVNVIRDEDGSDDRTILNYLGLRVGVLF